MSADAPTPDTDRGARADGRSKLLLIVAIAVLSGLTLAAATQTWVAVDLVTGAAAVDGVTATGQSLSPALSPIAIAALASALVLTIAGPLFRRVLGGLVAVLGVGILLVALTVASDPRASARSSIAAVTGLSGDAQYTVVDAAQSTGWPIVAMIAGPLLALAGLAVILLSGRWRAGGRKYQSQGGNRPARAANERPDRIADWDALSDGDDPTHTP